MFSRGQHRARAPVFGPCFLFGETVVTVILNSQLTNS